MKNILYLPKFHPGQSAYLHHGTASFFHVKIQDVYRYKGEWYYDVDASCYSPGMELEYVSEKYLTKKHTQKPKCRLETKTLETPRE